MSKDALDRLAADVASLDPRLRVAGDEPECFMCGKRCRAGTFIGIETDASARMHAHTECAGNADPVDLAARYWMAVRAAFPGVAESPNPAAARVRGGFL